jgi:glucose-1-phosphate thymidylyltransferase
VVKTAETFIGSDPFVFYLGDNILVGGIKKFIDDFNSHGSNCHLVLSQVPDPNRFGVADVKDGKIIGIEEKPKNPKSDLAVTGIYVYDSHIFEAVNNIKPSARGELEISDAHQYLLEKGFSVSYSEITGWWKDTGKPSDLLEANRLVLDNIKDERKGKIDSASIVSGRVVLGEGTKVTNSNIRGPVIIGNNVEIEGSYIGPYSAIGDECKIINSEIEYSILMNDCSISNISRRIEASLLGTDVELLRSKSKPVTHRFILGDQSRVEID